MSYRMSYRTISPKCNPTVLASFLGVLYGLFVIGPLNALPSHRNWLNRGDLASLQLGWEFFRQSPLVQWPLTAVPNYGTGFHTVLTTGNALVELPLKFLSPVLPTSFQYVGMWILTCFALQGFFAVRLLSNFIKEPILQLIGSIMFISAPTLLFRIAIAGHPVLGAHWLILWALHLYFSKSSSANRWSILVGIALMINIYIAVMVSVIYFSALMRLKIDPDSRKEGIRITKLVVKPITTLIVIFVAMGFLEYGGSTLGTGFFRMNLLAFVKPGFTVNNSFSFIGDQVHILGLQNLLSSEGEGFQYLGLGVLLGISVLAVLIYKSRKGINWVQYTPIAAACAFLFLVALSNRVIVAQREFVYPLPEFLLNLRQSFRAATRFAWPAYYVIITFVVVSISKVSKIRKRNLVFLMLFAVINVVDQAPGLAYAHQQIVSQSAYISPLIDPTWKVIGQKYKQINVYPNFDLQVGGGSVDEEFWNTRWFDFAQFAVDNHLSTGFGYFSRPITQYFGESNSKMLSDLENGSPMPDTIYIISNKAFWENAKSFLENPSDALVIDGYFVILGPRSGERG